MEKVLKKDIKKENDTKKVKNINEITKIFIIFMILFY